MSWQWSISFRIEKGKFGVDEWRTEQTIFIKLPNLDICRKTKQQGTQNEFKSEVYLGPFQTSLKEYLNALMPNS